MSVWVIWNPVYRLDGLVKLITAAASVPTAILLIRLAPCSHRIAKSGAVASREPRTRTRGGGEKGR